MEKFGEDAGEENSDEESLGVSFLGGGADCSVKGFGDEGCEGAVM